MKLLYAHNSLTLLIVFSCKKTKSTKYLPFTSPSTNRSDAQDKRDFSAYLQDEMPISIKINNAETL